MKELLRRGLHAAIDTVLRLRSRPYQPAPGSRCVVIAPHADDESLGCAGLILMRRAAGLPVNIVYVTDGAASHPGHPRLVPAELARIRRAEAIEAMRRLQVDAPALQFLDAPDGTLDQLSSVAFESLALRLSGLLAPLQPTELFLPCRDDGSSDHIATFRLTRRALELAGLSPVLMEYPVWARWRPQSFLVFCFQRHRVWRVAFPPGAVSKRAVLDAYASQTEATPPWFQPVLPRGFVTCFESAAEYFFVR
jgi:LmbE family N-acetylglucosaminyl deacetylase